MKKYNVLGIGNAVVDVISQSSDMFLEKMDIEKGIMQLVDRDRGSCYTIQWIIETKRQEVRLLIQLQALVRLG